MQREKATDIADLPHQFEGEAVNDECPLCLGTALDPRHVAWERAAVTPPAPSQLIRERGA